jgi:hypothetical protein
MSLHGQNTGENPVILRVEPSSHKQVNNFAQGDEKKGVTHLTRLPLPAFDPFFYCCAWQNPLNRL